MDLRNKTLLFQGDSITDCGRNKEEFEPNEGLGNGYAFMSAAALLSEYPDSKVKIYNRGISGHRVVDLYARWKIDCINLKPDILSLLVGINDTWHGFNYQNGVEPVRYERFYRELLEWTKTELPEVKFILGEPFMFPVGAASESWFDEVAERREIVKKLALEFDAPFIPYQSLLDDALKSAPAEYWLGDGVHPTMAGHKRMSDAFLKALATLV